MHKINIKMNGQASLCIKGTIPLCYMKEGKSFVAFSPSLDLSTCGKTFAEAKENFTEAMEILFEECGKTGTLDELLSSCGWVKDRKRGWEPPVYIGEERIEFPQLAAA